MKWVGGIYQGEWRLKEPIESDFDNRFLLVAFSSIPFGAHHRLWWKLYARVCDCRLEGLDTHKRVTVSIVSTMPFSFPPTPSSAGCRVNYYTQTPDIWLGSELLFPSFSFSLSSSMGNRILFLTWDDEIVLRRQKFCLWRLDAHQWAVRHPTIRCWKEKRVSFGWKGLAEWMPHPRYPSFLPSFLIFWFWLDSFLGAPHIFEWCTSQTHNGRAAKALFFPQQTHSPRRCSFFFFFFSFSFSFFGGWKGFLDVQGSFLSFLLFYFSFLEIYTVDLE